MFFNIIITEQIARFNFRNNNSIIAFCSQYMYTIPKIVCQTLPHKIPKDFNSIFY